MDSGARTRLVSVLVLVLVLGTGFVLGLAWDRRPGGTAADGPRTEVRERDDDERGRDDDRDRDGDRRRERRLIVDRVDLTPVQEERIDSIVEVHRERRDRLRHEIRSAYDERHQALVQRTRDAIRTVLTPEQRTRYDTLLARHDRKEEAERRRDGDDDRGGDEGGSRDGGRDDGRDRR